MNKLQPKRCTFELSQEMYDSLSTLADQNHTSVTEVVRKFVKLGLLSSEPGTVVLLRRPAEEQPVLVLI